MKNLYLDIPPKDFTRSPQNTTPQFVGTSRPKTSPTVKPALSQPKPQPCLTTTIPTTVLPTPGSRDQTTPHLHPASLVNTTRRTLWALSIPSTTTTAVEIIMA